MGNVFSTGASIKDESLQPEGLLESSRGSERSEDPGVERLIISTPGGVTGQRILPLRAPLRGASFCSYVFRWSTLRSDHRLLSGSPSGCNLVRHLRPAVV